MSKLDELRDCIVPTLRPYFDHIAVFGSAARGEETAGSDVDLLVRLRPSGTRPAVGLFRWLALEEELKTKLGRQVDLVSEEGLSPYVRPYVERDKVVLYEEG